MRADIAQPRQDAESHLIFLALLAASAVILGSAFAFQFIGGLQPCELCLWQRYPYAITIGLAGVGIGLSRAGVERRLLAILVALCGLTFLIGAGIAVFHVGVEQKWWEGTSACVGSLTGAASAEDLRQRLLGAPVVRCDAPAWTLFGISMAGYNALLSLALGVASLVFARKLVATPAVSQPKRRQQP
jgi:disulfide bond formation protein DsbB